MPDLAVHRLATTAYAVVLPAGHELASRGAVALQELAAERFVDAPAGFGNRDVLDAALSARGIVRDIAAEATETSSIPVFVANGLGVALLPELLIPPAEGVAVVALRERLTWDFNVITRTSTGEATSALLEQLLAAY